MEQSQYNFLFSFIWNIANDVLVNAFNKGDYKKVILPMWCCAALTCCSNRQRMLLYR